MELERLRALTAHEPDARGCVLRYYDYRRVLGAAEHARALDCFGLTTARDPDNAEVWAGLSLLTTDAWAHGFGGHGGRDALLVRARETARRAMDIDGGNLHANLALMGSQYFSGADYRELAERTGARIYLGAGSGAEFPHVAVKDGDEIEFGQCCLRFLQTPGHTLESICILMNDRGAPHRPGSSRHPA